MADDFVQNEQQQFVEQLSRSGGEAKENFFVISAGDKVVGFVAQVIGKYDFNYYTVRAVELNVPGSEPVIIGSEVLAVNVAEPFLLQGNLPAETYIVMFKIGENYCFYAPV
jgi:rRNA processing protein Gar1